MPTIDDTRYDIDVVVGADYFFPLLQYREDDETTPIDLTGAEVSMQFRVNHTDAEPLISLTSDPADGITLNEVDGEIVIHVTAAKTELLPQDPGGLVDGVYDIFMTLGGIVTRLVWGRCRMWSRATQPVPGP